MPTAAPDGPGAPHAATARHRDTPAPPLPTTATKRARPPTADNSTLASSPLPRPTNDVIVVSESPQQSPTKRSRTTGELAPTAPSTPPGRNATPATPLTPTKTTTARTVPPTAAPLTTAVPKDVARICGIPNGYADDLTTALSIVYEADESVGAAVNTIL
ncbi:hypothetical protein SBRCBS47491_010187 [Sporothrix bragantina]|uniref:Uncharacterized protein n=1 Tax=Sporothrix bragantina TaxID=671064 RepID=A0ABP0D0K7_9PEZI